MIAPSTCSPRSSLLFSLTRVMRRNVAEMMAMNAVAEQTDMATTSEKRALATERKGDHCRSGLWDRGFKIRAHMGKEGKYTISRPRTAEEHIAGVD